MVSGMPLRERGAEETLLRTQHAWSRTFSRAPWPLILANINWVPLARTAKQSRRPGLLAAGALVCEHRG